MNTICDVTALWDALCGGGSSPSLKRTDTNASRDDDGANAIDSLHDVTPFKHYALKNLVPWFPQPSPDAKRELVSSGTADTDSDESSTHRQRRATASILKKSSAGTDSPKTAQDYRNLHNAFIQSLLFEQVQEAVNEEKDGAEIATTSSQISSLHEEHDNITARSPLHRLMGFSGFKSSSSSDDDDNLLLDPQRDHVGRAALAPAETANQKNNEAPLPSKKRRLLHRLHPSRHVRLESLSSLQRKHRRSKSASKLQGSVDSKDQSSGVTNALHLQPNSNDEGTIMGSNSRPSALRSVLPRKNKIGGITSSGSSSGSLPTAAESVTFKPSTYYLAQNVQLYKDRSSNSSEPYIFDPLDTIHVSMVQGKSAALGKLREKTSLLNSHSSGAGDAQDDAVTDSASSSLSQAPALDRISSYPAKVYNVRRTPSGISSFIGHDADAIKVIQGFLPNGIVETRSILKIKVGFLRINYGILLRWNTHGKIVVIVLKKSTTGSFLKDIPPVRKVPVDPIGVLSGIGMPSFFNFSIGSCEGIPDDHNCSEGVIDEHSVHSERLHSFLRTPHNLSVDWIEVHKSGSCTIVVRSTSSSASGSTETIVLTPPYLVPQPNQRTIQTPTLKVRVVRAQLPRRKKSIMELSPYIKFSYGQLHHRTDIGRRSGTRGDNDVFIWSAAEENSPTFVVPKYHTPLNVELCDAARNRHLHGSSLIGPGSISLSEIEPMAGAMELTVKLHSAKTKQDVDKGTVTLEVLYIDHNKFWAKKELQARYEAAMAEKEEKRHSDHRQGSLDTFKANAEAEYCVIC